MISSMTKPREPLPAAQTPTIAAPLDERPVRFISLDEEGYFMMDGMRVSDADVGSDWLTRMRIDDGGRAFFEELDRDSGSTTQVIVEAFDQPLVANDLDPLTWQVRLPYGVTKTISPDSLRVDEWDRFHFRTTDGVPGVLNRSAQSRFFQATDDYDDESVTVKGRRIEIQPLFHAPTSEDGGEVRDAAWWSAFYDNNDMRWDLGREHPLLDELIPPLKITRCRILVLGCGQGHDAAWWARRGHIVTAVDFSKSAIERARNLYGENANLRWLNSDAFSLPQSMTSSFDVIFEHTLYCAIPPERRQELARTWWRLLSPRGRVLGIIPTMDKEVGPPYGGTEWELRKRLLDTVRSGRALFRPLIWKRLRNGPARRNGKELFFAVERGDSLD